MASLGHNLAEGMAVKHKEDNINHKNSPPTSENNSDNKPHNIEGVGQSGEEKISGNCPKCPIPEREKECPPCKPCGRCPEPAFECKKVPNYNVSNVSNTLPIPMLNSFADFN